VTNQGHAVEFRVLGPLEARLGGRNVPLSGAKQRAVLAVLLLRAGEVVTVERLVDEVWGDDPPPSAAHSLESYVSRLRQLFNGHGPAIVRRGAGYALELCGATLDADRFLELHDEASHAAAEGDAAHAVELAASALAVWRGPALADVALASAGRAEAERLEELRLRTYEVRFDAELELGRHERVVGELQALVGQNPYRERFVAQLMLALYRSGRHAEALEAYERTRAALSDDLGLQPSLELQQLSGQIVRQDPQLRRRTSAPGHADQIRPIRRRARRMADLVVVGSVVAATMAFTASGSAPRVEAPSTATPSSQRVALVLARDSRYPHLVPWASQPFREHAAAWDFEADVIVESGLAAKRRVEEGDFDLVLVFGHDPLRALSGAVRTLPDTKFVFLDASLAELSLDGVPNAHAIRFADEQTSQLAGYLSALVPLRAARSHRVDKVSVVAGQHSAQVQRAVSGFERGVERARGPEVSIRVDYVEASNLTACERVANDQIDAGSDVVFVDAGHCGLGALAVARTRGVWGIGAYEDGVDPGPHILAITYKDYEHAIGWALDEFGLGDFRSGKDDVLGLNDNYAVGIDDTNLNPVVAGAIWSKVVHRCSQIRQATATEDA
jgi:DNA-binding SARP family transcriptional activator/basic membrane lipoprotein Med (substrate-binding protein (PBP1-ABC) superfamily)